MSNYTLVWLISFFLFFLNINTGPIPDVAFPMSIFGLFLVKLCGPLALMSQTSTRRYLFSSLWEILKAPIGALSFRENFIADVLVSLIKPNYDLAGCLCFYVTGSWLKSAPTISPNVDIYHVPRCSSFFFYVGPIINLAPLWIRFLQTLRRYCTRRLLNY
jgi:hypothetical protein